MNSEISVTVLTKNSQKYLKAVLEALKSFNEVVLYDNGSTDQTLSIAKNFPNVTIIKAPFEGFGPTHNKASAVARNDWVLSIDSDEIASPEMVQEIDAISLDKEAVYSFPRKNYYNGKFIKWCGWYPDRQIRLYNKTATRFSDAQVHEAIISDHMRCEKLQGAMIHYSYANVSDFLTKMQSYSDLFAQQNKGKKTSSVYKAISHGFFAFFKSYIIKKGFLGGYEGYLISVYNGQTAFYKYLKLLEANECIEK